MRKWMLPALGLATVLAFSAGPALADDCTDKVAAMRAKLEAMPETQEVKQKIAGQIDEALSKCQAGTNDPWMGVDPRVMEG
jgi:hypothetical protein